MQPPGDYFHLSLPLLGAVSLDPQFLSLLADSLRLPCCVPFTRHLPAHRHTGMPFSSLFLIAIPASLIPVPFNFSAETYKASDNHGNGVVCVHMDGGFQTEPLLKVHQWLIFWGMRMEKGP